MMFKRLLQLTLILIILFLAKEANAGIIIRPVHHFGLVGYWNLDEGEGTTANDHSGNNNHGTMMWMATSTPTGGWTDGQIGKALEFDGGDDYVEKINASNLASSQGSISLWINPYDDASRHPLELWQVEYTDYLLISHVSSAFYFYIEDNNDYKVQVNTSADFPQNAWYHFVVTQDGGGIKIYVNGAKQSLTITDDSSYWTSHLSNITAWIGKSSWAKFYGLIDEVRVYNRALSAGEVGRLYKLSKTKMGRVSETGLVGYWPFEEGTGTIAGDHSGQANNGTRYGTGTSTWWTMGKRGTGGQFNGSDDYVDMGDVLDITDTVTIGVWVKYDAKTSFRTIVNKGTSYGLRTNGDEVRVYLDTAGSPWADWPCTVSYTIPLDEWLHIAYSYDGTNTNIYVNGRAELSNCTGESGAIVADNIALTFGQDGENQWWFSGIIDEVRIYNRALSAAEISDLYQATRGKFHSSKKGLTEGLVGMWSFDGPDIYWPTNTANDRSGQGIRPMTALVKATTELSPTCPLPLHRLTAALAKPWSLMGGMIM